MTNEHASSAFTRRHSTGRMTIFPIMLMVLLSVVLASCNRGRTTSTSTNGSSTGATPTGGTSMITKPIQIESVEILIGESNPPQVRVRVAGIIPDSCTKAREPEVKRNGSTFTVTIIGERPEGMACAQVVSPYDQTIMLGTVQPGDYTVVVNNVTKTFSVS